MTWRYQSQTMERHSVRACANALETCLVHKSVANEFLPKLMEEFKKFNVDVRGCERTVEILGEGIKPATEEDYATVF